MKKTLHFALLTPVIATLAAGCATVTSTGHTSHMAQPTVTSSTSAPAPAMADAMFAQMMIPHHEQAIEMSELAKDRTTNPQVLLLAARIEGAQEPEIAIMRQWLEDRGYPVMDADGMGAHMGHGMSGMLSEGELQALRDSVGAEFDDLYLTGMIAHHEGAIDMAQDELDDGTDPRMRALAESIIEAQRTEIEEMRELLAG